jgi:DNA modification methylase
MADMVFTDPPYGVSYGDKNKYLNAIAPANRIQVPIEGDHLSQEDTSKLWSSCWQAIYEHLKPGCAYYCCSADADLLLLLLSLRDNALHPHQCIIWVKNNIVLGRRDYKAKHETIVYGWKEGRHTFYGPGGAPTVWEIDKPHSSKLHPTMKPVEVPSEAIQNSSKTDDIVLDPFLGSGTTAIAAILEGFSVIGIERELEWAMLSEARIEAWKQRADAEIVTRP